jgi:hypothetical protein
VWLFVSVFGIAIGVAITVVYSLGARGVQDWTALIFALAIIVGGLLALRASRTNPPWIR